MRLVIFSLAALFVSVLALFRADWGRKHNLKLLADLRRDLEKALHDLRKRGELANEIAHEIKNPITAILCSAETLDLILGPTLSPEHRRSLRYIKEYGDNLLRLVSDFIDLNRTENHHIVAKPLAVEILPTIKSIVGLLESNAIKRKIVVSIECVAPELKAYVDPRHLKQIAFNLIHNAIKYTQPGGAIVVRINSDFPAPRIRIAVSDNGPGVPPEMQAKIFDAYARYERSQHSSDLGSGLGLALCKALVELAGGSIAIKSDPGLGSEFEFVVPEFSVAPKAVAVAESHERDSRPSVEKPCAGQRLLIVDRNTGVRDSLSDLVLALGGVADRAGQVSEALTAISRFRYDAVIVDQESVGEGINQIAGALEGSSGEPPRLIVTTEDQHTVGSGKTIDKPLNGKRLLEALTR